MAGGTARRAWITVDVLIAAAFVALLATLIAWGRRTSASASPPSPWSWPTTALSWRTAVGLARKRRAGTFAALALDALLLACLAGLAASSVVLFEHVLWWAPAVPGSWWARVVHLLCSYWGFVLAFAHAGLHFRAMAGPVRRKGLAPVAFVAFVAMGGLGVRSFLESGSGPT